MDVGHFDIIKGVVVSSKSRACFEAQGVHSFVVSKFANKSRIKKAVESIWEVKVEKVRTINTKGCSKKFSGKPFRESGFKKAMVTLKKGYKMDMPWQQQFSQGQVPVVASEQDVKDTESTG